MTENEKGAGPSGISTAFTIAEHFKDSKKVVVDITIFDESSQIGGRMILDPQADFGVQIHAEDIASGCLGQNRVLRKRAKEQLGVSFGMNGKSVLGGRKDDVGFWDGNGIRSALVRPSGKIGTGLWIKLVWKYGASFWKARKLPKGTVKGWESLVGLGIKKNGKVFEDVEEWVREAKMTGAVGLSAGKRLSKNGVGGKYVTDVLRSEVRRQTGGELEEMSDLALSMALEREDRGICVDGRGGRMVDVLGEFLDQSKAMVRVNTKVTGLKREMVWENETVWILELAAPGQQEKTYEVFDKVIVAAPWNASSVISPREPDTLEEVMYYPLWITIISSASKLDRSKLGNSGSLPHQITQIIPIQNTQDQHLAGVHEIIHLRDLYHLSPPSFLNTTSLYRILSSSPPPLDLWADSIVEMYQTKIENAYPVLYPRTDGFGKFKIGEDLWWAGAMETIASEVDGAWVAGENIGELVRKNIEGMF